jgi:threonine synthase
MEGYKTIAYEIFHQLGQRAPDKVFLPVGGGDGAWGVFKGFDELYRLKVASRMPEIVACQSAAGAPLVHAWEENLAQVEPVATSPTIAFSIVDRQSGNHALMAIQRSNGRAVAVDDGGLRSAEDLLRKAGLCVEPSSAASLAGLRELVRQDVRPTGETIVLIATGTGLRWPATFAGISSTPPQVAGSISDVGRVVDL